MDKNWPNNAADMDSSLVFKIPHAAEQLSLCATATEPKLESPCITAATEACAPRACAPQQANHQLEAQGQQWKAAPARHNYRNAVHSNEDPAQPKINE